MVNSRDYWSDILRLADEQGVIQDPLKRKKGIPGYLSVKLGLPISTVRSLLKEWEEEGRIHLEKEEGGRIVRLRILSLIKKLQKESRELSRVLILIDWENLLLSMESRISKELSVSEIFLKAIKKISREIGEIVSVFIFTPPHSASVWGETFQEQGFFIISCPKVTDKKGETRDTVDETLIDFGRKMIPNLNLSHICIGTGDRDLSKLYQEAIWKRLKTVTIAASEKSLSSKLVPLSDTTIILSALEKGQE